MKKLFSLAGCALSVAANVVAAPELLPSGPNPSGIRVTPLNEKLFYGTIDFPKHQDPRLNPPGAIGRATRATDLRSGPFRLRASAGYVVVPKASQIGLFDRADDWTPEATQIVTLEEHLWRLFTLPDPRMKGVSTQDGLSPGHAPYPLSDYFIRYAGVVKDGTRMIVGKATHRDVTDAKQALSILAADTVKLSPFGGGTHTFTVTYDPQTNKVVEIVYDSPP